MISPGSFGGPARDALRGLSRWAEKGLNGCLFTAVVFGLIVVAIFLFT